MGDSHIRFGGKKNDGQLYTTVGEGAPMNKRMVHSTWFLSALTLLAVSIAGCGRETINVPDTTRPFVSSTSPLLGAAGVALGAPISATFSKLVNCPTASTFTVAVAGGGAAVTPTSVTCSGSAVTTATFTPSSTTPLVLHTLYTATITGATDLVGNVMASPYSWNFEAVAGPSVVSTTPTTGATGLLFNPTISATFLQLPALDPDSAGAALNCSTVTAGTTGTFTVTSSAGAVTGTVACNQATATATFTPTSPALLAAGTLYTATLTTGVTNVALTPLASPVVWTFTTDTLPTVTLTVPTNGTTGILLNQAISATFSKAMNCATLYSPATTFTVTAGGTAVAGNVSCTGNGAIFTPSNLLAVNTLYTATITTGALDAQGEPMASNYSWNFRTVPATTAPTVISTNPANLATGVPTNIQAITATFSEAMNPATIGVTTFTLKITGGAAVTGTVAYDVSGSVAVFTPSAALTAVPYTATITGGTTGVQDLAGNVMASSYTWTFTPGAKNITAPTVSSTIPVTSTPGPTGVPPTQVVSATFSEAMNPLTISGTTFTLTGPGTTAVAGLVAYVGIGTGGTGIGNTATFTPAAALATGLYTATITTGAQDGSGNALASNYPWTFTVGAANNTKPTILSAFPADQATNVPINQAVSATFSKAMNPLTITSATFTLTDPHGAVVTGTYVYNAATLTATFTPTANLAANTIYTADITTGATDSTGNPLGSGVAPNPWMFTTFGVALPPPVVLNSAAAFGDIGGTAGMTNQGIETVINNGSIGTTAVSTAVTGFHDTSLAKQAGVWPCIYTETTLNVGQVNSGTGNIGIYTAPPPPNGIACPSEGTAATLLIAQQAAADALSAYISLTPASMPGGIAVESCPAPQCIGSGGNGELGGRTLQAGVYKSTPGTYAITSLPLTLDGAGNPNATWVFQMASSLTVGGTAPQSVTPTNSASCANVFWQVGSAAVINGAGGGTFCGTVISYSGATTGTAGITTITTINGRLLSLIGSVTLVNTVINVPAH
jgi:hypothetical protein